MVAGCCDGAPHEWDENLVMIGERGASMRIKRHDKSDIVELDDGSRWRIWPGDFSQTLQWLPATEVEIAAIDDAVCSHAIVNRSDGSRVRVIGVDATWPVEQVRRSLKSG